MSDDFFTPEQLDSQIERFSRSDGDADMSQEARLLQDMGRVYREQATANRYSLERVLERLLQEEAHVVGRTLSPPVSLQERRRSMERPIPSYTSRRSLWQRLNMAAAVLFVLILVGSTALVINLAHQQKGKTNQKLVAKTTTKTSTTPVVQQSNLYVSYGKTLKKLDSKSGNVLWTYTSSSPMYAPVTVTVADGMVYFVPQDDGTLYALNAKNGHEDWHLKGKNLIGKVVVARNTLYITSFNSGNLYALNATHGQVLWQRQLTPYFSSLTVVDGVLYGTSMIEQPNAPVAGNLYALHASDGSLIWRTTVSNQFFNAPVIVNGVLYIDSTLDNKGANPPDRHGYVYAFDAKKGTSLWQTTEIKAYLGVSPVVANGMVYIGTDELGVAGPAIYAFRASDGSLLWKQAMKHSADTCLLVANDALYVAEPTHDSGVETPLVALNANDGSTLWSSMLANYFGFSPGCALYNGRIYVLANDGFIHVLRAADGKEVKRYPLSGMGFTLMQNLVLAP